ncbi:TauD/TfdA family dioxygenase [Nocardia arthritidis]|nr:TauD/TfdA family dioxygenase [Nocardia arthritidis]
MFDRLVPGEVVKLRRQEAARVWTAALRAACAHRGSQDSVEVASGLIAYLPSSVIGALHRFRTVGTAHNVLLVRNLCASAAGLPATPATRTPSVSTPVVDAAALLLLAVSWSLGEPFTFRSLIDGRLVEHIVPVAGHEDDQNGGGSTAALQWHVEDGFTDDRCDYFGLLCLRGHPGAATVLASARNLDLPDEITAVLRQPRFIMVPSAEHDLPHPVDLVAAPILTGPEDDPEICFDAIYQRPADPDDRQAAAAMIALTAALDRAAIGHHARPGDLLLVDNRRTVHGRTVFQPRYDGTDRWLLRTYTCASVRAHRRRGALRVVG